MKRVMTAIFTFVALFVISTAAQGAQKFETYEVEFKVHPNKGELRAVSLGQNCDRGKGNDNKKKGCVKFGVDDFGLITIHLGTSKIKTCAQPSTRWVISMIELSSKGYRLDSGELSNKGEFEDYLPLDNGLKEAFPQVDQASGVLYEAESPKNGATRVTVLNLNNNDKTTPKDIWYRVSVADCNADTDVVLVTDPRWENEGKG